MSTAGWSAPVGSYRDGFAGSERQSQRAQFRRSSPDCYDGRGCWEVHWPAIDRSEAGVQVEQKLAGWDCPFGAALGRPRDFSGGSNRGHGIR